MALTQTQFLLYSGYSSSDVNTDFLQWTLDNIDEIIQHEVGTLFQLIPVNSSNTDYHYLDYVGNNTSYINIDAWQPNDLVIQIGSLGSSTPSLQTLVENRDYTLIRPDNKVIPSSSASNPVVGIKLVRNIISGRNSFYNASRDKFFAGGGLSDKLYSNEFIRITGVWGWSNGYPADLENLLYQIVKAKLEYNANVTNSSGAGGVIKREKDLTSEIDYGTTDKTIEDASKLAFDIMGDSRVKQLINKYKQCLNRQVVVS